MERYQDPDDPLNRGSFQTSEPLVKPWGNARRKISREIRKEDKSWQ